MNSISSLNRAWKRSPVVCTELGELEFGVYHSCSRAAYSEALTQWEGTFHLCPFRFELATLDWLVYIHPFWHLVGCLLSLLACGKGSLLFSLPSSCLLGESCNPNNGLAVWGLQCIGEEREGCFGPVKLDLTCHHIYSPTLHCTRLECVECGT
jgi:hypothetical protein